MEKGVVEKIPVDANNIYHTTHSGSILISSNAISPIPGIPTQGLYNPNVLMQFQIKSFQSQNSPIKILVTMCE